MAISKATAEWTGDLKHGKGVMRPAGAGEVPFSMGTRFEGQAGSNPEELIGAALAGCYSMAMSLGLEQAGIVPKRIATSSKVHLEKDGGGFSITRIDLSTEIHASGDEQKIRSVAEATKKGCPVGKALAAPIELAVSIVSA